MAVYEYTALDASGRRLAGFIEAERADEALRALNTRGLYPIGVAERRGGEASVATLRPGRRRGQPRAGEITLFTQELALLLTAGQPLTRALSLLEGDASSPRVQALAGRLRATIAGGNSLAEALAAEGSAFPPVYAGMVKAAEASGTLAEVLGRIADTREREQKLQAKIASALLYPSLLVVIAIGVVLLMMGVVVPQFKSMLGEQTANLPPASRAIMAGSDWLAGNWQLLAIAASGLLVGGLVAARRPAVQRQAERAFLALPLAGSLLRLALTARFCRTLGVLLESGLGLPAALALTRDVIDSPRARGVIDEIGIALRQGTDFTEPMKQSPLFPPMVTSLLRIGAESGALSSSALKLADMYEAKLEIAMQRLVTVLEPAIILTVSVVIGFIVLTIMSAIMGVYDLTGV